MKTTLHQEEELREAFVNLERAWNQERQLRSKYEGLLESIAVLSRTESMEQMFSELLNVLRGVINFEEAFVLSLRQDNSSVSLDGWKFVPLVTTASVLLESDWRLEGILARAIKGHSIIVFDASHIPEWQAQSEEVKANVRSVLYAPLRSVQNISANNLESSPNSNNVSNGLILVCTHSRPAFFSSIHRDFVQHLAPLVDQALLNIETRNLYAQQEKLQREKQVAQEKSALLEHVTEAVGIGIAIWDQDPHSADKPGRLVYVSSTLMNLIREWESPEIWWEMIYKQVKLQKTELCGQCNFKHYFDSMEVLLQQPNHEKRVFNISFVGQAHEMVEKGEIVLIEDITERRYAEEELKKHRQQLEKMVEERTIELVKTNKQLRQEITERKSLENQLVQAQKLESIGQLAAGIAHEINTPIQYIGDNNRFLQESFNEIIPLLEEYNLLVGKAKESKIFEELLTRVENYEKEIDIDYLIGEIPTAISQSLEGINHVAKIVTAMKEFSHPGVEEKELIDINRAIESTITVSRNEWKYVTKIDTDFDSNLPFVLGYPGEFNQVILNIIVNAANAIGDEIGNGSTEKGTIFIKTRHDGDWTDIRISDTGNGIPEEIKSKIFDPFFTTKKVGKGTGQGLAISHDVIVGKHGGTITFETEIGKGTTFIIRLPINSEINSSI